MLSCLIVLVTHDTIGWVTIALVWLGHVTVTGAELFQSAGVLFGPGKAANAGGVATSALEMSQNAARQRWSCGDSEAKLRAIMADVHHAACTAAERYGRPSDYVVGANSAGFERVAHAMLAQGVI